MVKPSKDDQNENINYYIFIVNRVLEYNRISKQNSVTLNISSSTPAKVKQY